MEICTPTPVLVNVHDAARMLSVSDRTVWRLLKEGRFPEPLHIGTSTRWQTSDVAAFVSQLAEQVK